MRPDPSIPASAPAVASRVRGSPAPALLDDSHLLEVSGLLTDKIGTLARLESGVPRFEKMVAIRRDLVNRILCVLTGFQAPSAMGRDWPDATPPPSELLARTQKFCSEGRTPESRAAWAKIGEVLGRLFEFSHGNKESEESDVFLTDSMNWLRALVLIRKDLGPLEMYLQNYQNSLRAHYISTLGEVLKDGMADRGGNQLAYSEVSMDAAHALYRVACFDAVSDFRETALSVLLERNKVVAADALTVRIGIAKKKLPDSDAENSLIQDVVKFYQVGRECTLPHLKALIPLIIGSDETSLPMTLRTKTLTLVLAFGSTEANLGKRNAPRGIAAPRSARSNWPKLVTHPEVIELLRNLRARSPSIPEFNPITASYRLPA